MKSFKQYQLSESVDQIDEMTQGKEYTQAQLQKKIQSGNWEATHDIKPGKHVEMRHHSGKRVTVQVKEEVDEDIKLDEADGKDYHSVHVNGRMWKTFDSKSHADNVAKKIKGATVHKYDAERLQRNYAAKSTARNAARGKQWDE